MILQASFLEIYNEEIRDLLGNDPNLRHEIKMNESKDVTVTNLKVEEVFIICFISLNSF